ncbi:hypothetical protein [Escherichia phage phiWec179]|nr:hypothetical protein [Escherichia phage phiWec179]BDU12513.1 hypothetical protein [Escherichia phage phiWec181]BDU12658.1 hypothetical protein [Escherichia phage phiWec186]
MADLTTIKVTDLVQTTSVSDTDFFVTDQAGITKKTSLRVLLNGAGVTRNRLSTRGTATSTLALDVGSAEYFYATLSSATCTISFTNIPVTTATVLNFSLALRQGSGANKVVWPASVKWSFGRAPVLSYRQGAIDTFEFISLDNGASWIGSMVMAGVI